MQCMVVYSVRLMPQMQHKIWEAKGMPSLLCNCKGMSSSPERVSDFSFSNIQAERLFIHIINAI